MQNKLKFSAFEGLVVIDGNTVSIMDDDVVDYENGETPMTVSQFCSFIELSRKVESLKAEKECLMAEKVRIIKAPE